jgi:diguanylate cyclase (GGDEF)-like protein
VRILIADDDATSRLMLKAMASKLGHECLVATDGSRAWDLLTSEGIDVLLTDWMMPGMDGPELCRRVRHDLFDRYIYIVLITALGNHEQVLEGMSAGADDYLVKPVDPFAVQTRLVAAERVSILHHQLSEARAELEQATVDATTRSLTDALTGLGNRRRMEEDLASTHARALRSGRAYGVALFDIDHFKLYNDNYGHLAGDEVLRQVARCLGRAVRAGEWVYRYGGEEFLLLMPECSIDGAEAAAGRIRRAVAQLLLPHDTRPTTPQVVTLSGGVSCWTPGSTLSVAEVLQTADDALFEAKSQGRNRVHGAAAHHEEVFATVGPSQGDNRNLSIEESDLSGGNGSDGS